MIVQAEGGVAGEGSGGGGGGGGDGGDDDEDDDDVFPDVISHLPSYQQSQCSITFQYEYMNIGS